MAVVVGVAAVHAEPPATLETGDADSRNAQLAAEATSSPEPNAPPVSDIPVSDIPEADVPEADVPEADTPEVMRILGVDVPVGARRDLKWTAGQSFSGRAIETPVIVIRGAEPGTVLCLTAATHGDELNGVEIIRRVLANIENRDLAGTVIGVPIVNLLGFTRGSRYLPDRRDLNRYFPGDPDGSLASRLAHGFFTDVVHHCDRLVDFHTGSFKRTNLPQLRANLLVPEVRKFAKHFGATALLHKVAGRGTLRNAATLAGVPTVTFELGEPGTLQLKDVRFGVRTIETLLDNLEMVRRFNLWPDPQLVFSRSHWLRAYRGGILTSTVKVGARVEVGDVLGVVTNPVTNEESEIFSPYAGRLVGRALNQFVLPGFATFHIGIEADDIDAAARVVIAEAAKESQETRRPIGNRAGGAEADSLPATSGDETTLEGID